jgi:hypothetical protein
MSPFRIESVTYPGRAKVQFTTSAQMPHLIYQACLRTGVCSNTVYIQHAVVDALARDLGLDREQMIESLPTPRGPAAHLFDPAEGTLSRSVNLRAVTEDFTGGRYRIGPANTVEEIPEYR